MGNEDDGHMVDGFELVDQFEDLGLNGDVKSRRGLIADQNVRFRDKGNSDDDPLPHAAGELERILFVPFLGLGDSNFLHDLQSLLLCHGFGDFHLALVFIENLLLFFIQGDEIFENLILLFFQRGKFLSHLV